MRTRAIALMLGFVMIISHIGCRRFTQEQQTLDEFVASLRQGDYAAALSYCHRAEHIKLRSGMNLIYFQAVIPTGKVPAFLRKELESDSYPGSISREGIDSIHSWAIKGIAKGFNLHELAPKAPANCYVLETRAYGLVGFTRVHSQPRICFIIFTHG